MFTQCPECGTVFRVTAPVLRAAQGQVRCGVCDASFDALRFLTDSVDSPAPAPSSAPAAPAGRPTATRSTPSEDEGRALAQITAGAPRDAERAPVPAVADEANVLEPVDVEDIELGDEELEAATDAPIPDEALEFDAPPAEWDRVFVPPQRPRPKTPLDINLSELEGEAAGATLAAAPIASGSHRFTLLEEPVESTAIDTGELKLVEEDTLSRTDEFSTLNADSGETAVSEAGIEDTWFESRPAAGAAATGAPPVAAEVSPVAPFAEAEPANVARAVAKQRAFLAASVLLGLALLVQLVHLNREALAANALVGRTVSALYARLGTPIEPRYDLGAYEVKQWGAATDSAPGALRLRASIINKSTRAQPYPLLRITLEDRFGSHIARGEFPPAEYLPGRAAPTGLLEPGARADADLMLDDPGAQAVGFELDVCLRRAALLNCGAEQKNSGGG